MRCEQILEILRYFKLYYYYYYYYHNHFIIGLAASSCAHCDFLGFIKDDSTTKKIMLYVTWDYRSPSLRYLLFCCA